ncbi:LOG family protein [uncultured Gimesia sp.]|jgi:uncharacterized protein (TIGR00730 family)|uniref:LOG family protein n=1 Tax=uncultured Gimesia sp. TaxID=1678688 RepID=UPI0026395203|nr:LOG family protein [uncultured Gimesia sp.]
MSRKYRKTRPRVSESDVLPTEHCTELYPIESIVASIKDTADKLKQDNATRGDLKILDRALKELRYAFKVFTPYRKQRKVTVFGSARTLPDDPAYQQALQFGRRMAEEKWMILTGAGPGIMEAAHVGAGTDMSMGVNIVLPFEQEPNYVIHKDEKLVNLNYFFTRKLLFVKEVHAIVCCAGGFGTLDEAFETLTLVQTGKRDPMPIVLLDAPGNSYWKDWEAFLKKNLLQQELISEEDLSLFYVTDSIEAAVDEVIGFYSVYNSMRYVKGRLVLRLHVEPSDEFVEQLNNEFRDILESGIITKVKTHELEKDDAHLAHLPRISLLFNRKSLGRLRQMIDMINNELDPNHDNEEAEEE